jgi:hypothetical protein
MGLLYKNVCYPTSDQARAASCSDITYTYASGTNVYTRECNSASTSASMTICTRKDAGICTSSTAPWPVYPTCTFDGGVNFAHDWFAVVLILLALVWGGKKTISLFEAHHDRD